MVLAGHSLGGTVISQVAERLPDRVAALVYVAAYLAPSGKSAVDLMRQDGDSLLTGNILLSDDRLSSRLRPEVVREALYADCSEEDIRFALTRLCPEPVAHSRVKLELSEQRFGSVPRVYIECLRDRTIGLRLQRSMQAILPCSRVEQLDTDHSPFFSAPEQLAQVLCGIA